MASRVYSLWRWGLLGGGLSVLAGLLAACRPSPATPATTDPSRDLVATQVALIMTQTAVVVPATPIPLPATPTVTPAAPTPAPPTPVPPTPEPTLPPTPDGGPCAPDRTTFVTPTPGDWDSYLGYRYNEGWLLDSDYGPRGGFLITPDWGVVREGFSVEMYFEGADPDYMVVFLQQRCQAADGSRYWEIIDVLTVPQPESNQAVLLGPEEYHYGPKFWEPARAKDGRALMGAELGLICSTPVPRPLVALIQTDPAALPDIYDLDTRVPVTVLQAWHIDLVTTQRFKAVEPLPTDCKSGYTYVP